MENALLGFKELSLPVRGDHLALQLGVEIHDVVNDDLRDVVVGQDNWDQIMANTSEGVGQIKPCNVNC